MKTTDCRKSTTFQQFKINYATEKDINMFNMNTTAGQLTLDFVGAQTELICQGVLEISPNMRMCLNIPTRYALAIANDKATPFNRAAVLCWVLESRSAPQNASEAERKEIADAIKALRQKIQSVLATGRATGFKRKSGTNAHN